MKSSFLACAAAVSMIVAASAQAPPSTKDGAWVTLFNGTNLDNWDVTGNANWRVVDGAIEADMPRGYLVTRESYGDFEMKADVWVTPDSNAGLVYRITNPKDPGIENAYELNINDKRADQSGRTGAIVNIAKPLAQVDSGNKWTTVDIVVRGAHMIATLDGVKTAEADDGKYMRGPVALQAAGGLIRYRNVQIRALGSALASAPTRGPRALAIYAIDVEGGNATLVVAPSGESLLIDTGNGGAAAARDAGRIVEAAKDAGVSRIDHLITTHWHGDHFGGLAELAKQMPIAHYYDHGSNVQPTPQTDQFLSGVYQPLVGKAAHTVVKAGDTIVMAGVGVRIVAAAGEVIAKPLRRGGSINEACAGPKPVDAVPEDRQSIATYITFGRFRALHPGDLTRDVEFRLVCPVNRVGPIDVLLGPHHGQDTSNSATFIHALRPRAAVMNNGTRKGGYPDVMNAFYTSPGFEDLWQLHFSQLSGQEYAVPGLFTANVVDDPPSAIAIAPMPLPAPGSNAPPAPLHNGRAYWIKLTAREDGSFIVTNARNGFAKTYAR